MHSPTTRSIAKRACDACRRRKVKCDAGTPVCANCRTSGLECTYHVLARKRGPKPSRERIHRSGSPSSSSPQYNSGQSQTADTATPHTSTFLADTSPGSEAATAWRLNVEDGSSKVVNEAMELRRRLLNDVDFHTDGSLHGRVQRLIGLVVQYGFGGSPLFHERSLRQNAAWVLDETLIQSSPDDREPWMTTVANGGKSARITAMRAFSLVTAICGMALALYVDKSTPLALSDLFTFHKLSKDMLELYQQFDIENPDSSSLIIRTCHSIVHQQTTGQTHSTTFINGQARLLAQNMRLHDESVLEDRDPIEAQLLRSCFWQLLTSDRAAASLLSRSFSMHESLFDCPITVHPVGTIPVALLDPEYPKHQPPYEERLLKTYWLGHRMRSYAADLTFGLRNHRRRFIDPHSAEEDERQRLIREHDRDRLADLYIKFTCVLDETPEWIINPGEIGVADEEIANYQRESFSMQRSHWFLTYHCMSVTILHQCMEHGLISVLGLNDSPLSVALKETEIARDFVIVLEETPFRILQYSGEFMVEQIRHVGTILLRINESAVNGTIMHRAEGYLTRLINVLSRLDSKASDVMANRHEQTVMQRNQVV